MDKNHQIQYKIFMFWTFFSSFKWVPWVSVSQWYHNPTFFTLFRYSTLNMMWHVLQDWCSLAADMYWKYKWTKYLKEPTILTGPDGIIYLIQWLNTLAFRIRAFLWTPSSLNMEELRTYKLVKRAECSGSLRLK